MPTGEDGTALVTGASGGIGEHYAARLAERGYDLVLVSRGAERLDTVAARLRERTGVRVQTLAADLSRTEGVTSVGRRAAEDDVALVVNNAGVNGYGPFERVPPDVLHQVAALNTLAPTMLARAALPGMIERGRGAVVNVASLLAFSADLPPGPLPHRAVYASTKSYLVTFTRTLAAELHGTGVTVQVCCPGPTATDFHRVQGLEAGSPGTAEHGGEPRGMDPGDVVTASLAALERREVVCVPGLTDPSALTGLAEAETRVRDLSGPGLAERYRT
ncbi:MULTISPECIES: SDR family NAD(P)-dependent oxidoreductase [Nocardiopsis]|uniref:Short-chain dehydrogenase n=1 Tax=Nocardiopsis sinuspersici TaxID=501010 RepID=A0A1V3C2I0_9ACTN|nr:MULTISPECIES: SDR family NAD(P)-dependent oxidoreductase [Nocardiopsis]OOC54848.1 short-chain dehydrogenase [Nocardiopsis sinuspersici]